MSSKYLEWLARDEKPEEKRELTPAEKRSNWWYYHKWHVVICAAVVLVIGFIAKDIVHNWMNRPDYQVAYIGSSYLPDATVDALELALAEQGEDLNGDGQVLVLVNQYLLHSDDTYYMTSDAAKVQLMADEDSFLFLMEDPAAFQEEFAFLAYPDGSVPEENAESSEALWIPWADCPVLTGLELGSYTALTGETGDSQALLSGLCIARRAVWNAEDFDNLEACAAFWQRLTAGAEE